MRIAFSGTHRVGKSTLLEAVAGRVRGHVTVDEPYHLLEEDGHEAADPPSLEDFVAQLARSLEALDEHDGAGVLFDRCPVDVVAYLRAHDDADGFELASWLPGIRAVMGGLDLVVFVPIETPERVPAVAADEVAYRRAVHDQLVELLVDDGLGLDLEVLVVEGPLRARVEQVLARLAGPRAPG